VTMVTVMLCNKASLCLDESSSMYFFSFCVKLCLVCTADCLFNMNQM
jgi:hypothetical protein